MAAIRQGFLDIGVEDNSVLLFPELMDSASLFLTANCDTIYFLSFMDLTGGPMVVDVPPSARRRESSAPSMTCGSGGSPTSASRAGPGPGRPVPDRRGRATTARCRTAAFRLPRRTTRVMSWAGRS